MRNTATLVHDIQNSGVSLSVSPDGKLKVRGKPDAIDRFQPLIREHRAGIIEALKTATNDPAHDPEEDRREAFDERAGYPRDEAERLAERQVQGRGTEMSWRWRIEFPDHALTVSFSPPATREEVLGDYPTATAASLSPQPSGGWSTMTTPPEWETVVRGWLSRIGEHDSDTINEVIELCYRNVAARGYYTGRAEEAMSGKGDRQ